MIPCYLVNLETGRKIRAKSVVSFCRQAGLNSANDAIHIFPILRRERLHHQGWALPEFYHKKVELKDCYGNLCSGEVKDLLYQHKIPACRIWNLINGSKKVLGGIMMADTNIAVPLPPNKPALYTFEQTY
jgi:hypothetical protein